MLKIIRAVLVVLIVAPGCSATHLVYTQETVLGIDLSVGVEGQQKLTIGFDRDTFSIVPKKEGGQDAMSVTAIGYVQADGLRDISFENFIATGDAAKSIAKSAEGLAKIKATIYGSAQESSK